LTDLAVVKSRPVRGSRGTKGPQNPPRSAETNECRKRAKPASFQKHRERPRPARGPFNPKVAGSRASPAHPLKAAWQADFCGLPLSVTTPVRLRGQQTGNTRLLNLFRVTRVRGRSYACASVERCSRSRRGSPGRQSGTRPATIVSAA